jgi:localization factor PodJL
MTSGAPWSVKGIDPKAREIAKDLARRSGMTLGEYINQMLMDENAEASSEEPPRRATPVTAPRALAVAPSARPVADSRPPKRTGDDLDRVLTALNEMSARLESSERSQAAASARFEAAIVDLKTDQSRVAQRLHAVELGGGAAPGRSDTLRALEGALNKVAGHLQDGEARSRDALIILRREMSQDVARVTDQLGLKVQEVENRSADAIAQVGAEVTRVASVVEQRLRRADDAQAEALEKLGAEIARITERLSERIAAAERRSAQAIDDVGEQMARVTDRIHQRQERSSSELADRMRQSEERTAKLLEEAREKIERRLAKRDGADVAVEETSAFVARWSPVEPVVQAAPEPAPALKADPPTYPAFLEPPALAPPPQVVSAPEPPPIYIETPVNYSPVVEGPSPAQWAPPPAEAMEALALELEADPADTPVAAPMMAFDPLDDIEPVDPAEALRPSTRELIAAARAAARATAQEQAYRSPEPTADNDPDGIFAGASYRKARVSGSMRGMMLTGGAVASIGLAATGYVVLHPEIMGALNGTAPVAAEKIPVGPPSNVATQPAPQAALTLTTPAATPADAPASASDAETMFLDAQTKVDAGDASGVAPLRTAANLGYAPAQRRLGKLYEDGGAGVPKDEAEGRRWTQRAAANGDARGMHNLGLDYYEGSGGVKNLAVAAQWFNRAAELGLRDSQYNLARFYEAGMGVKQDLPTAYKWYLIAARAGDTEAGARGEAMKTQLKPALRASIEKEAMGFRPDAPAPPTSMEAGLKTATSKQLALAQRALSKLGYYQGPDTGVASQSLGAAIQQYQRDRGLAANGTLSPELVQTFANISQ